MLVIVLAVVFLGERMTRPRIAFVLAGIAGMLLIVRPGSVVFQGAALLALGSAVFYAVFQITHAHARRRGSARAAVLPGARRHGDDDRAPAVARHRIRHAVDRRRASSAIAGMLGTVGHFLFILAFQRAPASALTPFTYMQLVFATLIGWVVFGDFPDAWTHRRHGADRRQRPAHHTARAPARERRRGAAGRRLKPVRVAVGSAHGHVRAPGYEARRPCRSPTWRRTPRTPCVRLAGTARHVARSIDLDSGET